jgi:hypothetical protein
MTPRARSEPLPELVQLENIHKTYRLGEADVPVLRGILLTITPPAW